MHRPISSAVILLAAAATASADIVPIYVAPAGAPLDPTSFAISPATGDIAFLVSHDYYVKKQLGNVKYNDFKVPTSDGTASPPQFSPDGTFSFLNSSPTTLTITRLNPDGTSTTVPLSANGSPIDPATYTPVPANGQSAGDRDVHVRQSPHSSIIIATRVDGSHLGETSTLDSVDADFVGLSSRGHDVAVAYASPGGGMPHVKVFSLDGSQSNQLDLPQFSSIGTPVIGGDSLYFVSTTPGTGGLPPVLAIETNPLYSPDGTVKNNPLYTGSNRITGIDTPAVNDVGALAFVLTDTDDITHLPVKHIVHRDLAARTFLTDLSTGDPLNGSTITDLYLSPDSLADDGSLLFYATLADGSSGLFLTTVPEPASLLAACGLALLPLARRRR